MVPSSSFRSRAVFTVDLTKEPSSLEAESQEHTKQRPKLQVEYLPSWELTYPQKGTFEDDFPFPKVGYVNSLEGIYFEFRLNGVIYNHLQSFAIIYLLLYYRSGHHLLLGCSCDGLISAWWIFFAYNFTFHPSPIIHTCIWMFPKIVVPQITPFW